MVCPFLLCDKIVENCQIIWYNNNIREFREAKLGVRQNEVAVRCRMRRTWYNNNIREFREAKLGVRQNEAEIRCRSWRTWYNNNIREFCGAKLGVRQNEAEIRCRSWRTWYNNNIREFREAKLGVRPITRSTPRIIHINEKIYNIFLEIIMENKTQNPETRNLTDQDFYQQACAYFYYHAEQRTSMINYFIAVFAACLALYGTLISAYPFASILVAVVLLVVSLLFFSIDRRNRFDVKFSQSVISQIESDYEMNKLRNGESKYVYGVFSNEDNIFRYYGLEHRREAQNAEYRRLRKIHKKIKFRSRFGKSTEDLDTELISGIDAYLVNNRMISRSEFEKSIEAPPILSLSKCIRFLYYTCMFISTVGIAFSIYVTCTKPVIETIAASL